MNNRGRMVVDVCLAVLVAALTLVLAPGLGIVALLVAVVAILCAISFGVGAILRRRRRRAIGDIRREFDPRRSPRAP
jgi:hypothetical protein